MNLRLRIAVALTGIALPIAALAAAPSAVSGLSGNAQPDGSIIIRWTPLPDPTIVLYRLYYSAESILDSEGLYDDYEETEGPVSEFIFYNPPKQASLFVTVLAVNSAGEESEAFAEEVRVDIPKKTTQPQPVPAPTPAPAPKPTPTPAPAAATASSAFSIDVQIPSMEMIQQMILNSTQGLPTPAVQSSSAAPVVSAASSSAAPVQASSAASVVIPVVTSSTAPTAASSSVPPPVLNLPSSAPAPTTGGAVTVPTFTPPLQDGKVHLLIAEALSPIQVKLTMSTAVTIEPTAAPRAFRIVGENGTPLHISQLLISDRIVILDTAQQQKDALYTVQLSEPLMGIAGEPLDVVDRSAVFTGHELGSTSASPQATVPSIYDPLSPADVMGFRLRATPEAGGKTYTVVAQWQPDLSRNDLAYYLVRQSLDGGATFSEPEMAPMDIGGIEIKGAQPGELGISLSVVNIYGKTSTGVFDKITLPGEAPVRTPALPAAVSSQPQPQLPVVPTSPPKPVVTTAHTPKPWTVPMVKPSHTDRLSQTGMGLFVVGSSMIGSYVGWRRGKKLGSKK